MKNLNFTIKYLIVIIISLLYNNMVFAIDYSKICTNTQTVRVSQGISALGLILFQEKYAGEVTCGYLDTPYEPNTVPPFDFYGLQAHPGIDFPKPIGTPVYSATDGLVVYIDESVGHVAIRFDDHRVVNYYHMNSIGPISVNSKIKKGGNIGTVGKKGNASGPHLHIEVRKDYYGDWVNGQIKYRAIGSTSKFYTIDDLIKETQDPVLLIYPTVSIIESTSDNDGLVAVKFKVVDPNKDSIGWDAYLLGADNSALPGSGVNKKSATNGASGAIITVTWTATEAAQIGLQKGKNYKVGVDGFNVGGTRSVRTYSAPFTWRNSLAIASVPIVTVGADKSLTATYSVTDPDGGTLSADAYLLNGDRTPLPNNASLLTKKTTPDVSPSGTTFTAKWTTAELAKAGLQNGLFYTVGVNGYDISGIASDRAYSRVFIWNDSTNPLNSTCNEPATLISSIVPNVYSFNNGYQAFEVTCARGRTGGVRLPKPISNSIQNYSMRICAYREVNCNIPASNCRDVNATDNLDVIYSKRTSTNISHTEPIVGSLAEWVCGNEN